MPCLSCVILPPPEPERKTAFKRYVARPDSYGVVHIPDGFVPAGDMDPVTGEWEGWVPEKTQ